MEKKIEKHESNDYFFPYTINKELSFYLSDENSLSFQQTFAYLRKKLQIKPSRKTYIDSILKKCKVRFFKAINDCLKQCLKIKIKKFPQSFITNISIEKNKLILDLTVQELCKQYNLSNLNCEECIEKKLCYEGKEKYLKYVCYSKISDLYLLFIHSKRYKREIQYIKKRIGIKMFLLYVFVSENYINYFLFSKPHLCHTNANTNIIKKNYNNAINIIYNSFFDDSKKTTIISLSVDKFENNAN